MIEAVFILVAVLFGLKILWNLAVPYALVSRDLEAKAADRSGISLMPGTEATLLLISTAVAFLRDEPWPWSPVGVATLGGGILIASYVHMIVVGGCRSLIAAKMRANPRGNVKDQ